MPQLHACLSPVSSRLVLALTLIAGFPNPSEADTTFAAEPTTSSTATDSNQSAFPPSTSTTDDASAENDAEDEDVPEEQSGSASMGVFDTIHAALVTIGLVSPASTAFLEQNTNATGDTPHLAGALAVRSQAMWPGHKRSSQICRAPRPASEATLFNRPRKLTQTVEVNRTRFPWTLN